MMRNWLLSKLILLVFVFFILICFPTCPYAARILSFFPTTSKSHLLIHCSIADTLAKAGHEVTVLGGIPNVYENAKYQFIQIGEKKGFHQTMAREMVNKPQPLLFKINEVVNSVQEISNATMSGPTMQKFLQENGEGSFDLVIIGYLMNDFSFGLGAHFGCPIIVSFMIQPIHSLNKIIGNPEEYSYVPTVFSGLKQPLNFWQRLENYINGLIDRFYAYRLLRSSNEELYRYHFPSGRYPTLEEAKKNVSLMFISHHSYSQGPIRPNVPALIEIGGIQIKEKANPLPTDIAKLIEISNEGIIYFSLGTNVQGEILSKHRAKIMFDVLSKLPYKVLWTWGDSNFPGLSSNIIYKNWLPQDDILAHPNIKLFITHAGQGSIAESQHHGIPMVAMPLFGDQPANAANMVQSGFGVQVDYVTLTEDIFRKAILEVLNNEKYSKAVKQFSKLYRDRPMTPRQLVVYWTEYVLRHEGAKNLQSPAIDLNYFQLASLDVLAFLISIATVLLFVTVKCFCFLCCKNTKKVKVSKKKLK